MRGKNTIMKKNKNNSEKLSDNANDIITEIGIKLLDEGQESCIVNIDASVDDVYDAINFIIDNRWFDKKAILRAKKIALPSENGFTLGISIKVERGISDNIDNNHYLDTFPEITGCQAIKYTFLTYNNEPLSKENWDLYYKKGIFKSHNIAAYLCYGEPLKDCSHILDTGILTGEIKRDPNGAILYEVRFSNNITGFYPHYYKKGGLYLLSEKDVSLQIAATKEAEKISKKYFN